MTPHFLPHLANTWSTVFKSNLTREMLIANIAGLIIGAPGSDVLLHECWACRSVESWPTSAENKYNMKIWRVCWLSRHLCSSMFVPSYSFALQIHRSSLLIPCLTTPFSLSFRLSPSTFFLLIPQLRVNIHSNPATSPSVLSLILDCFLFLPISYISLPFYPSCLTLDKFYFH